MLDCPLDIIGLTERNIIKDKSSIFDVSLIGFKHYHTPTESKNGGTLLYVANHLNSKSRNDLNKIMYKTKVLESVFLEIIHPAKKIMIVGCIYKYPLMEADDFNDFLEKLLDKISTENKDVFLLGDYNMYLLKSDIKPISAFLETMTAYMFVPHIILPTRVAPTSIIDNIFSNSINFSTCT